MKKIIIVAIIAVVSITLVVGAFHLDHIQSAWGDQLEEDVYFEGKKYTLKDDIETFLLIGLDKFGEEDTPVDSYNNDKQADFLMLFVLDHNAQTLTAIQINRDTMVDVNVLGVAGNKVGTAWQQIALAHTYGNGREVSCHNTAEAVTSVMMGVKVNHYMSVTMEVVEDLTQLVGGVEVEVLEDFTAHDPAMVKGQQIKLTPEQATLYIRARKDIADSSNLNRMERQKQFITSLYTAMQEKRDEAGFLTDVTQALSDHMVSDRSVTQLQSLSEKMKAYDFKGVQSLPGVSRPGEEHMEYMVDEEGIKALIIGIFYEEK